MPWIDSFWFFPLCSTYCLVFVIHYLHYDFVIWGNLMFTTLICTHVDSAENFLDHLPWVFHSEFSMGQEKQTSCTAVLPCWSWMEDTDISFFFSFCFKFLLWSKQNCTKSTKILQKSSLQLRNRLCCLNYVCAGFLGTRSCSWQGAPLIYRCVVYLWTSCLFFSIFLVSSSVAFLPVMETWLIAKFWMLARSYGRKLYNYKWVLAFINCKGSNHIRGMKWRYHIQLLYLPAFLYNWREAIQIWGWTGRGDYLILKS